MFNFGCHRHFLHGAPVQPTAFQAKLSAKAWFAVALTFAGSVIVAMADAGV